MMEFRDVALSLALLGQFGNSAWMYIERRNDKTNERISELTVQVEELEREVAALKSVSGSAPTHADLAKVYDSINAQAETLNQLVGENRGQSDTLRLILNQIMQKGMQ